jgi:hypothetical protein
MHVLRLVVLTSCLALLGCGTGRLDRRTRTILAGATKVEVFRIDARGLPKASQPRPEGQRRISGFRVTVQRHDQDKEFAARLLEILADEKTHTDRFVKCFDPGVAFRVWKGDEVVDVLLCFKCNNFYCGPPKEFPSENGSFLGSPRRTDLVRLVKEAFPDDMEIQLLKEED